MTIFRQCLICPDKHHRFAEWSNATLNFHVASGNVHVRGVSSAIVGIIDRPFPFVFTGGPHVRENGEAHQWPVAQGLIRIFLVELWQALLGQRFGEADNFPAQAGPARCDSHRNIPGVQHPDTTRTIIGQSKPRETHGQKARDSQFPE